MNAKMEMSMMMAIIVLAIVVGMLLGTFMRDRFWEKRHREMGISVIETICDGKSKWPFMEIAKTAKE